MLPFHRTPSRHQLMRVLLTEGIVGGGMASAGLEPGEGRGDWEAGWFREDSETARGPEGRALSVTVGLIYENTLVSMNFILDKNQLSFFRPRLTLQLIQRAIIKHLIFVKTTF